MKYKGSYLSYILTYFFCYFSMSTIGTLLPVYLTGAGRTATEMSFIMSASSFFSFVMLPVTGYLNDKLKRPKILGTALMLTAGLMGILFSMSQSVIILFILNGLIASSISSYMSISEKFASIGKFRYGSVRVWGTLGYAIGSQAAGFAIEFISPSFIFVLLFISAILTVVGICGMDVGSQPEEMKAEKIEKAEKPKAKRSLSFLKNKNYLLYIMIVVLVSGSYGINMIFVPVLMTNGGLGTSAVGTVLLLSTLVEIPIIIFSHRFMDKLSVNALLKITIAITTVQYLCYVIFSESVGVTVLAVILLKAMASTLFVMINLKTVRNIVGVEYTSTALGILSSVNSLASVALQNLAGRLVDARGIPALYIVLILFVVVGFVLSLFLKTGNDEKVFG